MRKLRQNLLAATLLFPLLLLDCAWGQAPGRGRVYVVLWLVAEDHQLAQSDAAAVFKPQEKRAAGLEQKTCSTVLGTDSPQNGSPDQEIRRYFFFTYGIHYTTR